MNRTIGFFLVLLTLAVAVLGYITKVPGETAGHLFVGWIAFLERSFHRLTWNWSGVATAAVCVGLLLLGGHSFLAWLINSVRSQKVEDLPGFSTERRAIAPSSLARWTWKRTAQLLAVFMLLFMSGTAFIGLVHQTAWLATAPESLSQYRLDQRYFRYRSGPIDKTIAIGVDDFVQVYNRFPPNGVSPELRQASHSWLTRVFPYLFYYDPQLDLSRDWDDAENGPSFRRFVPQYLNPNIGVLRDGRGYALSHYAGNCRLFAKPRPMTAESMKGFANTILCGEVNSDFAAWGDPANVRDPAEGINMARDGFGSTDERGANFLMLDGSVRFLPSNTDREVLTALATPKDD